MKAKTSQKAGNGSVTVALNQSLGHPAREKRFRELPDEEKQACAENTRRRAARLNLNELDRDLFGNIDREVAEMQAAVRALAVQAMMMAYTLAAVRHEIGDGAHIDALWRSVEALPSETNVVAEYAFEATRGVELQLRWAGVLLEESTGEVETR